MEQILSPYGSIEGILTTEKFAAGSIKNCTVGQLNRIKTPYGVLIPRFDSQGVRRKYTPSLAFYKSGSLKSISLQEQQVIKTPLGEFPAELVTFYENGSLKRIFPLNGKITGYWTEKNEYDLAEEYDLDLPSGHLKTKFMGLYFYETGAVKSVTLWPQDSVTINSPLGTVSARIGISFYPDGNIKSFEPGHPIGVKTPIGEILAYNPQPLGINGDSNSLVLAENGKIKSLYTPRSMIIVEDKDGKQKIHRPLLKPDLFDEQKRNPVPMTIEFGEERVTIGSHIVSQYELSSYKFYVLTMPAVLTAMCQACSACHACS